MSSDHISVTPLFVTPATEEVPAVELTHFDVGQPPLEPTRLDTERSP